MSGEFLLNVFLGAVGVALYFGTGDVFTLLIGGYFLGMAVKAYGVVP